MTRSPKAWGVLIGVVLGIMHGAGAVRAEPAPFTAHRKHDAERGRAIGFSNLVFRLDLKDEIGLAAEDFRIFILEALRSHGFEAVGAESMVFGKDHTERAELLLGGTVRELECAQKRRATSCRVGIEWQLLDVREDRVVYKMMARARVLDFYENNPKGLGKQLVLGALGSLTGRTAFRRLLTGNLARLTESVPKRATFRACSAAERPMPSMAPDVLGATVLVESGGGFGTGFLVSPDGLLLTAAHVVVAGTAKARLPGGQSRNTVVVRASRQFDVALLRIDPPEETPCLTVDATPMKVGAEIYAIGSPASEELAASLTRGIVSGVRNLDGTEYLQTDAAVNPGNSGGPLIDVQGRAVAVVSWKLSGLTVEGVAFGVPIGVGLQGLGLAPGVATDPVLRSGRAAKAEPPRAFMDEPDEVPSLDPVADARAARIKEEEERDRRIAKLTPTYVKVMKWGGLAIVGVGTALVMESFAGYGAKTTYMDFRRIQLRNDIAWATVGIGAGAFTASLFLTPSLPKGGRGSRGMVFSAGGAF